MGSVKPIKTVSMKSARAKSLQMGWHYESQMRKSSPSRRFPMTVTHLPITRCEVCHHTVAYRPGTISEALTEHKRRAHPEALDPASR
jgi:hypothetical protein